MKYGHTFSHTFYNRWWCVLSQEQEIVQMVWVCNVLPSLNASTKNTQLECRTWQQRQVGGPGFVATLRAVRPKPEAGSLFCSALIFHFFRGYLQRFWEQMRGGWGFYSWSPQEESSESLLMSARQYWVLPSRLVAINVWYRYPRPGPHDRSTCSNFKLHFLLHLPPLWWLLLWKMLMIGWSEVF